MTKKSKKEAWTLLLNELSEKGVLSASDIAIQSGNALSLAVANDNDLDNGLFEELTKKWEDQGLMKVCDILLKASDKYENYKQEAHIDNLLHSAILKAHGELLSSLQKGRAVRAALSAMTLTANALALGEEHRRSAHGELSVFDRNKRANDERNRGFSAIKEEFVKAARSRWDREKEEFGQAKTTVGRMATEILESNKAALDAEVRAGNIKKPPAQQTVKRWFIDAGIVPDEVKGKGGRPKNN